MKKMWLIFSIMLILLFGITYASNVTKKNIPSSNVTNSVCTSGSSMMNGCSQNQCMSKCMNGSSSKMSPNSKMCTSGSSMMK